MRSTSLHDEPELRATDATSRFYRAAYLLGFHPWEDLADHRPFSDQLLSLIAREEGPAGPPYGRALDLGCGSAVWGVQLARRGWQVLGVDNVPRALSRAASRIQEAGVEMSVVAADVRRLRDAEVEPGFRLVLDTGTFHGLDPESRRAMGREVSAVASDDATVILDCFRPGPRGPLPRGCTREDVVEAFPGWQVTDTVVADSEPDLLARALRFEEVFYRLRRG
jgi:SAM-dependent methyltransferase